MPGSSCHTRRTGCPGSASASAWSTDPARVRDGVIDEEGVVVLLLALTELVQVHTGFEVVCAGDVGHRDPFVLTLVVQPLVECAPRAVPQVQARIGDRKSVASHTRYPSLFAVIPALRVVR